MILDTDYKTYAAVFSCDTRKRDSAKAREAVSRLSLLGKTLGFKVEQEREEAPQLYVK